MGTKDDRDIDSPVRDPQGRVADGMRRTDNLLRQEAMTSELLDAVTGSEAILADPAA